MAREDQLSAQQRGDVLSREIRAAVAQKGRDDRDLALQDLDAEGRLQLTGLGMENEEYGRAQENAFAESRLRLGADLDRQKIHDAYQLDVQKMDYAAKIDRESDRLRMKTDADSKTRLMTIGQLWDTVNKDTDPNAVGGALDELDELGRMGVAMGGRVRDGFMADAKKRAELQEREMVTREKAVENRDPANRAAPGLSVGQQIEIAKATQDGYDMSGVTGAVGGSAPGSLPPAGGPMMPTQGAGQPVQNVPGLANRFALRGPALTAKASLDGARSAHQMLLTQQNPFPQINSGAEAKANLTLQDRKAWNKWNDQVQASARSLASARNKYLTLLPRPARQAMAAMAQEALSRIKGLSKGASSAANADQFAEMQRKIRTAFEEDYGVSPDDALRSANR